MIIIGSVIANTLFEVVAGRINCDFVFIITEVAAAALLVDGMKDMEELTDTGELVIGGEGMSASKDGFGEA